MLSACQSDNEHFCARYSYLYNQLLEPGVPPYADMKRQLQDELSNTQKDQAQAKFMLFVLEDWYSEIKPDGETPQDFCLRIKRWQAYR